MDMKMRNFLRGGVQSLTVAFLCLGALPAFAADAPVSRQQRLETIDQELGRGHWEAAAAAAREAVAKARLSPFSQDLAAPAARLAVAEAGLGRAVDAVWHWHVAQNLDPEPLSADALRSFGPPGKLLESQRLRPAGQPPAGLEVQTVPDLHLRRVEGAAPVLPPEVQALPVPKWMRVQLVIDAEGRPRDPVVLGGGLPGMTWEVLETVRTWRFEPFQADGRPRAVFYQLVINPPAGKPLLDTLPSDPALKDVEALLRAGDWKAADRKASRSWGQELSHPVVDRHGLAAALTLLALSDAGSGREAEAICRWQAAQTLDPDLYHADLSAYGTAGALLARNRWGDAVPDLAGRAAGVQSPVVDKHPVPRFHPAKLAGNVVVAGVIDARGGLRQPVAIAASAPTSWEAVEASALAAVCGWSYKPATASGRPVAMAQTVVFHYPATLYPYPPLGPAGGVRAPAYTTPLPPGRLPPPRIWDQN
jgi:hypothetical protein